MLLKVIEQTLLHHLPIVVYHSQTIFEGRNINMQFPLCTFSQASDLLLRELPFQAYEHAITLAKQNLFLLMDSISDVVEQHTLKHRLYALSLTQPYETPLELPTGDPEVDVTTLLQQPSSKGIPLYQVIIS